MVLSKEALDMIYSYTSKASIFKSLSICVNLYKEKYESFGTYYFIVVLAKFILI